MKIHHRGTQSKIPIDDIHALAHNSPIIAKCYNQ